MELPHQSSNTCRLARPRNCAGQRSKQVSVRAPQLEEAGWRGDTQVPAAPALAFL